MTRQAVAATVLWIIASALFSWYAANFANYNKTYGSVGAIVVLLMWFYITGFVVLLGAELNAEMERQTSQDTTRARWKPMETQYGGGLDCRQRRKAAVYFTCSSTLCHRGWLWSTSKNWELIHDPSFHVGIASRN